jgi:hypothetical protein
MRSGVTFLHRRRLVLDHFERSRPRPHERPSRRPLPAFLTTAERLESGRHRRDSYADAIAVWPCAYKLTCNRLHFGVWQCAKQQMLELLEAGNPDGVGLS